MFTSLMLLPAGLFALMARFPHDEPVQFLFFLPVLVCLTCLVFGFWNLLKHRPLAWTYFVAGLSQLPWLAIMWRFMQIQAEPQVLAWV